jgi:hypothetical protein
MPIDPNIILQGMPQGLDVNALQQQQMQGLQNINALERQRKADAAAEQEAMQAEMLRALSPAVAAAFEDPSDAGLDAAFSLVPEEFGAAADEQLAQLRAIPDVNRRKAVIRSALLQDDYGRALLAQLEPTANMRLQEGTAARRAALDERRLALEEAKLAGGPEASYKEIILDDGTLMLMDTKSGRIVQPSMEAPIDTALPPNETAGQPIKVQTPEAKQQAKERIKLDAAFPKASRSFRSSVTALDQEIADVRALLADEAGVAAITGTFNAMTPDIMRDATRAAALYDKITAGAAFTALSDLKAASPTGGALGNVSNEEGRRLKDSVATFSRKQATPDFVDGLERYLVDLEMARENVLSAFDETYSYRGDVNAESAAEDIGLQRERIEQETRSTRKTGLPTGVTVKKRN